MRQFWMVATLLLALGLTGCQEAEDEPAAPRVGVIVDRSGPAAYIGEPEALLLEALLAQYRADGTETYGLEIDVRDSGGDAAAAVALFEAFAADDDVLAVVGPSTSGESVQVAARAAALRVPLLSLAASRRIVVDESGAVNPWAFKFAQGDDLAAGRLAALLHAEGAATVALLYSDDGFGTGGAASFRQAAQQSGVAIRHDAAFPPALVDAAPHVSPAAIPDDVDAVMIWGTSPGPARLVKALRARGYPGQLYLSHGNASRDFIAEVGADGDGALLVGSRVLLPEAALDPSQPPDQAVLAYRSLWGQRIGSGDPSHFAGHAYDALEVVRSLLSDDLLGLDPAARRERLRDRIEALPAFPGVTGTFRFGPTDHAGLSADAFAVYRIQAGAFVPHPD